MKYLLIQLRRIGDVLMTTPAIRLLHESYPEADVTFLTESPSDQVLNDNHNLKEILLYRKPKSISESLQYILNLRSRKFDCVIDFHGNPRSSMITLFSGAPMRIGFDFRGRSMAYTHPVKITGETAYSAADKAQLLRPLGISASDFRLDFFPREKDQIFAENLFKNFGVEENDFVVSISPVSRQPYKVWPTHRFAQVADWLTEKYNAKILFLFGPGEKHFVESVRASMKMPSLPDYSVPTLTETLSILKRVNLHLGNDNGIRHFAVAADTPSLAIFGRPWAANWTPPGQNQHHALEFDPGCKKKCIYPKCKLECLKGVNVETVKTELEIIINNLN